MTRKYVKVLTAKPGQLRARWALADRGEAPDLCYAWGNGGASKADARILMEALEGLPVYEGRSLRAELKRRGYDITTLQFSIARLPDPEAP